MQIKKISDKEFVPFISAESIQNKVKELAKQMDIAYENKKPLFIAILNGSFMFAAELFKNLNIDAEICFIKLASYKGTQSSGHVITSIGLDANITGRHVIVLEDILETGKTLYNFLPQLVNQQPASLKIAVLLTKPDALEFPIEVDYNCFTISNKYVVGFGLDCDGYGRNINEIYQLRTE